MRYTPGRGSTTTLPRLSARTRAGGAGIAILGASLIGLALPGPPPGGRGAPSAQHPATPAPPPPPAAAPRPAAPPRARRARAAEARGGRRLARPRSFGPPQPPAG